jgi:hypothetical protein
MRWQLIIKEFNPELIYIKGEKNVVADALTRLDILHTTPTLLPHNPVHHAYIAEYYGNGHNEIKEDTYPLKFKIIQREQQKDTALVQKLSNNNTYSTTTYHGGGKERTLITKDNKICIPKSLTQRVTDWYHEFLCHPGETRTEATIRQHFTWPGMRQQVQKTIKTCDICQRAKRSTKKYGHLPLKTVEINPWSILCVDLIGPYTIPIKGKTDKKNTLWAVTMIDPATSWFEIKPISEKSSLNITNAVEIAWLTRYPWPETLICDRGTEFLNNFAKEVHNTYGITQNTATVRNPQANAILERIHQTLGNILRTYELYNTEQDLEDAWSGILAAASFALRATIHTTLQATPMQVVFGRDAMLQSKFNIDWTAIKERKRKIAAANNRRENAKCIPHTYSINDQILILTDNKSKYGRPETLGPYTITKINKNGTVRYRKGAVEDSINIRNVKPYYPPT